MSPNITPGTIIDNQYEVLEALAEGGMGTVFRAREIGLERTVAIKMLHSHLMLSEESRSRFRREGKILASLSHAHITRFYRFGIWENIPYIAMEFLVGRTLQSLLSCEPASEQLSTQDCLRIAVQVCSAMEYAHSRGVIHRDLTPLNIIVVDHETARLAKIIDFGLSRSSSESASSSQRLTQTGTVLGSIHYMSPEQCSGSKADHRSDIYSLGCLIFEAISGTPPFEGDNPITLIYKHLNQPVPSLEELSEGREIPEGLEVVLQNAMAKSCNMRYQSMSDFGADLELVMAGKGKQCKYLSHTLPRTSEKPSARPRAMMLLCVLAAVGSMTALYYSSNLRNGIATESGLVASVRTKTGNRLGTKLIDSTLVAGSVTDSWPSQDAISYYRNWLIRYSNATKSDKAFALLYLSKALLASGSDHGEEAEGFLRKSLELFFSTMDEDVASNKPYSFAMTAGALDACRQLNDLQAPRVLKELLERLNRGRGDLAPVKQEASEQLASVWFRTGNYNAALRVLENELRSSNKTDALILVRMSHCQRYLRQKSVAVANLRKACRLARATDNPIVLLLAASEFLRNDLPSEARKVAEESERSSNTTPAALFAARRLEALSLDAEGRSLDACDLLISTIRGAADADRVNLIRVLDVAAQISTLKNIRRDSIVILLQNELEYHHTVHEWLFLNRLTEKFFKDRQDQSAMDIRARLAQVKPKEVCGAASADLVTLTSKQYQWFLNGLAGFKADGTVDQSQEDDNPAEFEWVSCRRGERGLWWLNGRTLRIWWAGCGENQKGSCDTLVLSPTGLEACGRGTFDGRLKVWCRAMKH